MPGQAGDNRNGILRLRLGPGSAGGRRLRHGQVMLIKEA